MALKNNFYNEIFTTEQKWIDLIKSRLINVVYCKLTLKPFYVEKLEELKQEYNFTNNKIIQNIISIINNIINKIELFEIQYNDNQDININSLIPLLLTTQMNNIVSNEFDYIDQLNLEEKETNQDLIISEYDDDYMYDDFPEEIRKLK